MAFARPKSDANGECVHYRYTELSDIIRARNKREDRLLNVRLKFYEREKNIRLNIIRKQQNQLERVRTSLIEDAKKIQDEKQTLSLPSWMPQRSKVEGQILQLEIPEFTVTDWESDSNTFKSEIVSLNTNGETFLTTNVIRPHSIE